MTVSEKTRMPHGYSRYTRGCRCDVCRAAKATYMKARRDRAYFTTEPPPSHVSHGTVSTYTEHGCRCGACTEAMRAKSRRDWAKVKEARRP